MVIGDALLLSMLFHDYAVVFKYSFMISMALAAAVLYTLANTREPLSDVLMLSPTSL